MLACVLVCVCWCWCWSWCVTLNSLPPPAPPSPSPPPSPHTHRQTDTHTQQQQRQQHHHHHHGCVAAQAPLLVVPSMAGGDNIDGTTLLEHCLKMKSLLEEEERRKRRKRRHAPQVPRRLRGRGRRGGRRKLLVVCGYDAVGKGSAHALRCLVLVRCFSRCSPFGWQAQDARHHGRYVPEGLLRHRRFWQWHVQG